MLDNKDMRAESEEWEIIKKNTRKHAGYFAWTSDRHRHIEEVSVVQILHESLEKCGMVFFHSHKSRGDSNYPPDCEALSPNGERIGIEVRELVDSDSIKASKCQRHTQREPWSKSYLLKELHTIINRKDNPPQVKGGPYSQYLLIIYCDEPRVLHYDLIEYIRRVKFGPTKLLSRVFFLMSYSPWEKCCPFIELELKPYCSGDTT